MKINGKEQFWDDICDCLKDILKGLNEDGITLYTHYGNGITLICQKHGIEIDFDQYIGTSELFYKNINLKGRES
jgi:hypothetical protein